MNGIDIARAARFSFSLSISRMRNGPAAATCSPDSWAAMRRQHAGGVGYTDLEMVVIVGAPLVLLAAVIIRPVDSGSRSEPAGCRVRQGCLIQTDRWRGSRAVCTTPVRSSWTVPRFTAPCSRAAKAVTI